MQVSRSAILPYSAEQMFDVVADIEQYPQFLNWCKQVEVIANPGSHVDAKMHIAYGKLAFAFTTRNTSIENQQISLQLVDGPFSKFSGLWQFQSLGKAVEAEASGIQGSKISLQMDFTFERSLTSVMLAKMFEKIATSQLDAFQQRAHDVYGAAVTSQHGGHS